MQERLGGAVLVRTRRFQRRPGERSNVGGGRKAHDQEVLEAVLGDLQLLRLPFLVVPLSLQWDRRHM